MRVVRAADCRRMPWKNGGGETVEIAVFPEGAGLDAFEWRLSAATVAVDGPFSTFTGVDRTLTVLDGAGIELDIGGRMHRLGPDDEPLAFPGDVATGARLIDGPITDLNIMTRRGRWRHEMCRMRVEGPVSLSWERDVTLVFCANGQVEFGDGTVLTARDTAVLPAAERAEPPVMNGDASLYVLLLDRTPSS